MRWEPFISVMMIVSLAACLPAGTLYVDDNAANDPAAGDSSVSDPLEDGSAAHPFDAIQEAINAADPNDTVLVADGTYTGDGNRDIDFLGKAITVKSQNGPETCIIDCQGTEQDPHRAFIFHSGETQESILVGFTITNGYAPTKETYWGDELINVSGDGGAISCINSSSVIRNCCFYYNTAKSTHIYPDYSMSSGAGGAIACANANIILQNCVLEGNRSFWGGAIYMETSIGEISNCIIAGNHAGALFASSECIINHTIFHDNRGLFAIYGVLNYGGSIITGYSGFSNITGASSIEINNSIMWDENPVDNFDSSIIEVTYSNVENGYTGAGNISLDPRFVQSGYWNGYDISEPWWWGNDAWQDWCSIVNWQRGDYRFQYLWTWDEGMQSWVSQGSSPCVDSGDQAVNYTLHDIDGNPRPVDGDGDGHAISDMGAYEMYSADLPIIAVNADELTIEVREDLPPTGTLLSIHTGNTQPLEWSIVNATDWLTFSETSGLSFDDADDIDVSVDITGLPIGYYTGSFDIVSPNASNQQTINVSLVIHDPNLAVPEHYATIQEAINWAKDGEIVLVADGTYAGDGNCDIDFLGKAITVQSQNGPEVCVIDCQGDEEEPHRGFLFQSGETHNSVLSGFSVINGYAPWIQTDPNDPLSRVCENGGAVYCNNSSPIIMNCHFKGNLSWFLYEIVEYGVTRDRVFSGNGGAIACEASEALIKNCLFENNRALEKGGAVYCSDGQTTIRNCHFLQNTAKTIIDVNGLTRWIDSDAGALGCENEDIAIEGCLFEKNESLSSGGAVLLENSNTSLYNCIFEANHTEGFAAAVYLDSSNCSIRQSTFLGNRAYQETQGILKRTYPSVISPEGSQLTVENCILWDEFGTVTQGTITYSNIKTNEYRTDYEGKGNISIDPNFIRMGYWNENESEFNLSDDIWVSGDYHLRSAGWRWDVVRRQWTWDDETSPCIDAGNPGVALGDEPVTLEVDSTNTFGENVRVNMGAYGGTAEASMAPPEWMLLCDLDNSLRVDFDDFVPMARMWLQTAENLPADVSRDGTVGLDDLAQLAGQWLERAGSGR